ncbi:unnamed protein product, partial [Ectocarpus sp. 6 AP-2014]
PSRETNRSQEGMHARNDCFSYVESLPYVIISTRTANGGTRHSAHTLRVDEAKTTMRSALSLSSFLGPLRSQTLPRNSPKDTSKTPNKKKYNNDVCATNRNNPLIPEWYHLHSSTTTGHYNV